MARKRNKKGQFIKAKSNPRKRRNNPVARRNNSRRRKNGIKIPIALVAGLVPGLVRVVQTGLRPGDGWTVAMYEMCRIYTGYDPQIYHNWDYTRMKYGAGPLLVGFAVHWLLGNKFGINRALARMGIPLLRI